MAASRPAVGERPGKTGMAGAGTEEETPAESSLVIAVPEKSCFAGLGVIFPGDPRGNQLGGKGMRWRHHLKPPKLGNTANDLPVFGPRLCPRWQTQQRQ